MTKTTAEMWPDETPEQMVERVRREHGDAVADLIARDMLVAPKRKKPVRTRVGNKERTPPAHFKAVKATASQFDELDAKHIGSRWETSGLPRSGAGAIPHVVPRVGSQRRRAGSNDS